MTQAPLIYPVTPAGESETVNAIFNMVEEHIGFVPDGLKLYSLSPPLLQNFAGNIGYFREGTALPAILTTMIRYLVSSAANCSFCVDMNESFLDQMGVDLDAVRAARDNPDLAPLNDMEKSLLKLALKSVENPESISEDEIKAVRAQGWSDRDIFDATVQAANNRAFNYILSTFKIHHQGAFAS
jgi:uncharacterized peroxidase-related enzyme